MENKSAIFGMLLKQFIFLIRYGFSSSVIICQFSAYHSFLPALFGKLSGKKVLIVSAGNDAVSFPSIGYGNFNKRFLKWFTSWSYQLATLILPKHETLWYTDYAYAAGNPSRQGIKAFLPQLNVPHRVITNGYDGEVFYPSADKIPFSFLTVTGAMNYGFQKQLKGIDLILEVAKDFPLCTFTIIGVENERDFPEHAPNVRLLKKVNHEELRNHYSRSAFYLQLSMAEGFPNALCEAMLCECVPVGSAVFSIPEIMGETGFLLEKRDLQLLKELLQKALTADITDLGSRARKRILDNYQLTKRKELFLKLFRELNLTQ